MIGADRAREVHALISAARECGTGSEVKTTCSSSSSGFTAHVPIYKEKE
jgi:hypothetical protein